MDKKNFPQNRGTPNSVAERSARFLGTIDTPAMHRNNPDGSVSRKIGERLYTKPSQPTNSVVEMSRLAWVPEGIVFTPRTEEAPNGWGLPPTPDGKGTPGGDFPYVVINRYKHNNTPEYLHSVYSDKPVLGGDTLRMTLNWPALYIDDEDTVAWQSNRKLQQFMCRWVPILKEKRQTNWYAHRPKVREFAFETQEAVFIGANLVRADAGKPAFSRPLEGWTADSAQATCNESTEAKAFAQDSVLFRAGWQKAKERGEDRTGRIEYTLENLYANGNPIKGAALGIAAVTWWVNSPGHYAAMVNDYTEGRRAQYTLAGTAQLVAETISVGVTQKANIGLSFTAREVATIKQAEYPRGSRSTTWRHPVFGSVSVTGAASTHGYYGTKNVIWSEKYAVTFKHTDLIAVNNIGDFNVQREMLMGAAIKITASGDAMQQANWLKLVKEKQRREARYSAIRAKQGLPVDSACVGSEADIELVQAAWSLKLQTISYEEAGTPYNSPNAGTSCQFVLRSGQLEDFLKTRAEIKRLTLPFNPIGYSSAAVFSEDGTKAVVYAAELLVDDTESWHGEKLHFYEFDGDNASEIATSQIDITVTREKPIDPTWTGQVAVGRCKLYPYYDGNTLRWVDMKVNHEGRSGRDGAGDLAARRSLDARLVFDDGFEWSYCNTSSGTDPVSGDRSAEGVVRHILYLDLLHTERTHWVEYTFTPITTGVGQSLCTARILRNMRSPAVVKELYSGITVYTESVSDVWLVPLFSDKLPSSASSWTQYVHPAWRWGGLPTENFKASFWLGGGAFERPSGGAYARGGGTPRSTPLAPVVFGRSARFPDNLADGTIGNDYALGGAFYGQPFGFGISGAPSGEEWVYFKSSSLDLEAITGISGMKDNILPLWSIG